MDCNAFDFFFHIKSIGQYILMRKLEHLLNRSFGDPSICIGSLLFTNHKSQALIIIMANSLVSKHICIYF